MSEQIKDHIKFITHDQVTLVASHTQVRIKLRLLSYSSIFSPVFSSLGIQVRTQSVREAGPTVCAQ